MEDFRHRTINGIMWSVVSQIGRQGLTFIIGVILARLLSPEEFGLIAMVTVITNFASIFAELGLSAALVQKQDIEPDHLSSVFWLNFFAGLVLTTIFIIGSPLIADFYHEPILVPLTILISTNFVLGSFNIVQNTLLIKSLDFRTLSIVEILAVTISGLVAIAMAFGGFGVWSISVQSVLLSLITAILLWKLSNWRPRFTFNWGSIKDLLGFSLSLLGTKTLNYWARNIDYLLIGRFIGPDSLGIYNQAYNIMLFPLANVSSVISRVMFPSFSIIQEEKSRVKNLYLQITRTIALITFPMMLGLFVTVEPFTLTLFGPKWGGMIPILRILSLVGMIQSIGSLNGNLYLSQGRANLQFKIGLLLKINVIAGIVIGLRWGIIGIAIGYAIATVINSYPSFFFAGKLVDLTYWQLWRNLSSILACAITMAIIVWGSGILLPENFSYFEIFTIQVSLGIFVYSVMIHIFQIQGYVELRDLITEQVHFRLKSSSWAKSYIIRKINSINTNKMNQ